VKFFLGDFGARCGIFSSAKRAERWRWACSAVGSTPIATDRQSLLYVSLAIDHLSLKMV
jgi:hypothetical protein